MWRNPEHNKALLSLGDSLGIVYYGYIIQQQVLKATNKYVYNLCGDVRFRKY